jgi:transmembrane sensor
MTMPKSTSSQDSPDSAFAAAAHWHAKLSSAELSVTQYMEFEAWHAASPDHASAFRALQTGFAVLAHHGADPAVMTLRSEALRRARDIGLSRRRPLIPRWPAYALATAACLVVVATVLLNNAPGHWQMYTAPAGERRIVTLTDGSVVTLDENTRLRVRYSNQRRSLELINGQARFQVAHDASRPFTVLADHREVTATGTVFNIDVIDKRLFVTLLEGRVLVDDRHPGRRSGALGHVALAKGQAFIADAAGERVTALGRAEDATAWANGKLVFNNVALSDAAVRVNRYVHRKIVLSDASVGGLRISGVFNTGDSDAFVEGVVNYLPEIRAQPGPNVIRLFKSSGAVASRN